MATMCPFTIKCVHCKHSRPDPERNGEHSCFMAVDFKGISLQELVDELYPQPFSAETELIFCENHRATITPYQVDYLDEILETHGQCKVNDWNFYQGRLVVELIVGD